MKCTICGSENAAGQKFCQRCGNKLIITAEDYSKADIDDYRRKYFDDEDDFSIGEKPPVRLPRRKDVNKLTSSVSPSVSPSASKVSVKYEHPSRVRKVNTYSEPAMNKRAFDINQSKTLSKLLSVLLIIMMVAVIFNLGFIAAKSIDLHLYKTMLTDTAPYSAETGDNGGGADLNEQVQP